MREVNIKILLTGATGFIGFNFSNYLLSKGFELDLLVRNTSNLKGLNNHSKVFVHFYDGEFESVKKVFDTRKINIVIHLATFLDKTDEIKNVELLAEVSIKLTSQIFAAVNNIKGFYGVINAGSIMQMDSTHDNAYSLFKFFQEEIARFNSFKYGTKVLSLLINSTYASGNWNQSSLFNQIKKAIIQNEAIEILHPNKQIELLYIDDLNEALMRSIELLVSSNKLFLRFKTFGFEKIKIRDLVDMIETKLNYQSNITFGINENDHEKYDTQQDLENLPGWEPKVDLDTGLTLYLAAEEKTI